MASGVGGDGASPPDAARGTLFVVATPIGNLGDISRRAAETLSQVARVLAEDTRRTRALLTHLGIAGKPVDRLDAHTPPEAIAAVARRIADGEDTALVTDAGTPVISDPGASLVRAAAAMEVRVVPVPGASAVMAAMSVAGFTEGGFRFLGFLPRSGRARTEMLARVAETPECVVLFEAPQRVAETLEELSRAAPAREVVIARELTKHYEELVRGTLAGLAEAARAREWLGELTLVLGPRPEAAAPAWSEEAIDARIDAELSAGRRPRDVADTLALESGASRRDIYQRVLARRRR
jgi:16S rRNA (cytidine1402-2'-O)-methyltransferase